MRFLYRLKNKSICHRIVGMNKHYIGGASDLGVHVNGSAKAPEILLAGKKALTSFIYAKQSIVKSTDQDDLKKNYAELYTVLSQIYTCILSRPKDEFITLVGGDHSLAIPSALASTKRNGKLGLIWIDAHTDYHTMASTTSGNLHGLPCAAINGYGANDLSKYHDGFYIDSANTVIVGARSIDDGEYVNLDHTKAKVITMDELKNRGVNDVMQEAFAIADNGTNGVHFSYDLDFLDPGLAKGVSTPVLDGGDFKMYEDLLDVLKKYRSVIKSFDLVEYNPLKDLDGVTKQLALRILDECDF